MDAMVEPWHDSMEATGLVRGTLAVSPVIAGLDPAIHAIASPQ
ncbi:hypothetical protein [Roseibium sp. MMSF_3412]|nr:hypothetical protein [Roseibium sp. MMSF_3412]